MAGGWTGGGGEKKENLGSLEYKLMFTAWLFFHTSSLCLSATSLFALLLFLKHVFSYWTSVSCSHSHMRSGCSLSLSAAAVSAAVHMIPQ